MGFFEDVEKEYGVYSDSSTVRRDAPPIIAPPFVEGGKSIYELSKENSDPYITSETGTSVDTGGKLAIKDLSSLEHSTKIRKYMIDRFGAKYKNRDVISDKKMVNNFVDHMRWFNTNMVSTSGEIMYVSKATDEQKRNAGEAYKTYDKLGNLLAGREGVLGTAEGIKDYVFSAVVDPSNWVGALTGGVARATAFGGTVAAKKLMMKSIQEATKKKLAEGGTRKAAEAAGKAAGDKVAANLAEEIVKGPVGKNLINTAMQNESKAFITNARRSTRAKLIRGAKDEASKRTILRQTLPADATAAFLNDYLVQRTYLETGAQEEYSKMQGGFSLAAGAIAPGLQSIFHKASGKSGLADAGLETAAKIRRNDIAPMVKIASKKGAFENLTKELKRQIFAHNKSWAEKVESGRKLGADRLDNDLFKRIILGENGKGNVDGLAATYAKEIKIPITKDEKVTDVLTSFIDYLPKKDLDEINNSLKAQGLLLGDTVNTSATVGDLLAGKSSLAGQALSVMGSAKQAINGTLLVGRDALDKVVKEVDDVTEGALAKTQTTQGISYIQNIWRRLLVSSPATTAVNVFGFSQYAVGQTVVDLFSSGQYAMAAAFTKGATRKEMLRKSRVYIDVQAQKMKNFLDPYATMSAYKSVLELDPKATKVLFDSLAGSGIERSAKRYGIDPSNSFAKNAERLADAANLLTGVRIQDSYTKSQMFMAELDKAIRLNTGSTFAEVARKGDLDVIDGKYVSDSISTTLKSVFSKDYTIPETGGIMAEPAKLIEGITRAPLLGLALPFGRFFNNVIATHYQWGPMPFVPIAARILKNSVTKAGRAKIGAELTTDQAFAKAVVGTGALVGMMQYDKHKSEQGLGTFEVQLGSSVINAKYIFPFSLYLASARLINNMMSDEPVPSEAMKDYAEQIGIANLSKNLETGTEIRAVMDTITNTEDPQAMKIARDLFAVKFGNVAAGFTRPLDAINQAVGAIAGTDAAKDVRLADGAIAMGTQKATRYVDNIVELVSDSIDKVTGAKESPIIDKYITGVKLKSASRPGDVLPSDNFLAKIAGIKIVPSTTETEELFTLTHLETFKMQGRTNVAEYDDYTRKFLQPLFEKQSEVLRNSDAFKRASLTQKREIIKAKLKQIKASIAAYAKNDFKRIDGDSGFKMQMTNTALGVEKGVKQDVIKAMKQYGYETDIRKMSVQELHWFLVYTKIRKDQVKLPELNIFNQ